VTPIRSLRALLLAAFAAGALAGGAAALALAEDAPPPDLEQMKARFRRPATVPFPPNNPYSEDKRALGEALFHDTRLSRDGSMSCATCHDPAKGYGDGQVRGTGVAGHRLGRHTPGIWNLAWAKDVFWDGRARSLEEQALGPIQSADEMAQSLEDLVGLLTRDAAMVAAFRKAFPDAPGITAENAARAIATYERTLVSPPTRFDRWIAGDAGALTPAEVDGFRLFTGKAGCAGCHSGFALSDYAFHDIGLRDDDRGRGAVLRLEAAEHAFKTPSLREIGRSAPYMHDGSITTLELVLRHYEYNVQARPSLSKDLPARLELSDPERASLLAFLGTLTSEGEPVRPAGIVPGQGEPIPQPTRVSVVSQQDKSFSPGHVAVRAGERLWLLNNDTRTHNIRVSEPTMDFDSGAQEPGETVELAFAAPGSYLVYCGIHPKMEVRVEVEK
jgi:cytochrome c peroxidase